MGNQNQNHKNKNEDYEKDMEIWEGEKYVGVGIKRMKAYKCDLNIKALQKRRKKFWKLKLNEKEENYSNWSIIQNALTYDEPRDILYLKHFGIEPINGWINECKDKNGIIYKIPNYCINDPYFEREKKDCNINQIESETKKIKIYGDFEEFYLEINNKLSGKELKEECRKHENLDENVKLRLFVFGVEIKDEDILYQHNLTEDKPIYLAINKNK